MKKLSRNKIIDLLTPIYGPYCWYCGKVLIRNPYGKTFKKKYVWKRKYDSGVSIDHIIPKTKDGTNDLSNLALSCEMCNRAKHSLDIITFLKWLSSIRSSKFSCKILGKLPKEVVNKLEKTEWDSLRKDYYE